MRSTILSRHRRLVNAATFVAILGVSAALISPWILRSKEKANRSQCASNLHEIGIAAHNYHNDWGKLPPGYFGPFRGNGPTDVNLSEALKRGTWSGSIVNMLPNFGGSLFDLYNRVWCTDRTYPKAPAESARIGWACGLQEERDAWWLVEQNLQANTGQIKINYLLCPSDDANETVSASILYATHIANGQFQMFLGASPLGRTNYTAVAGTAGDFDEGVPRSFGEPKADFSQWIGCMYNRSTLTLGQITVQDGTSNTLLFGESLGGSVIHGRDTAYSWFGVGAMGTAYGLGRADVPAPIDPPPLGSTPPPGQGGAAWYRFSSRHPSVVNFCFADVTVRPLRFGKTTLPDTSIDGTPAISGNNKSDWAVLQMLAGRKDGFNADVSSSECD